MQLRGAADRRRPDLRRDIPLSRYCTLGVGGNASHFIEAETDETIEFALARAEEDGLPVFVLGGGSNLLIADGGVAGLVLRVATRGCTERPCGDRIEVTAAAGEPWDDFVQHTVERGFAGLECLSGIPGSVGATPVQNVGAYGQEVADTVVSVQALDRKRRERVTLRPADLAFGYRDSALKRSPDRYVVLSVTFALTPGGAPAIRYPELAQRLATLTAKPTLADVRSAVIALRRSKSMVFDPADENHRSCGSFFVNPVVSPDEATRVALAGGDAMPRFPQTDGRVKLSAGWLIERAGFARGTRRGNVGLSTRHALAIVCHDGASATDVAAFANEIVDGVRAKFGLRLVPEPVFWGFDHGLG